MSKLPVTCALFGKLVVPLAFCKRTVCFISAAVKFSPCLMLIIGWFVSGYVTCFGSLGCDMFPASSVAFAVIFPAGKSAVGSIVTLPWLSATFSPIFLFFESKSSTLAPASAWTVIGVLVPTFPNNDVSIVGLPGAILSRTTLSGNVALPFWIEPLPWWS